MLLYNAKALRRVLIHKVRLKNFAQMDVARLHVPNTFLNATICIV